MSDIIIQKTVFSKIDFEKVVNTSFSQFSIDTSTQPTASLTVDGFFQQYENIFYQIPVSGSINSHQYIFNKEATYLGININSDNVQALLDEITSLRSQLNQAQDTLNTLITI